MKKSIQKLPVAPQEGPWYLVYLKPKWQVVAFTFKTQEESFGHVDVWKELAQRLAEHYGITNPKKIAQIAELPYALPRGRVCKVKQGYAIFNGQDWPQYLKYTEIKNEIIKLFGLTEEHKAGRVLLAFDEHHQMLPDEQAKLQSYIGTVPY
jgi:hypothetical protein